MPNAALRIACRSIMLIAAALLSQPLAAQGSYHVIAAHVLGGDGGWDYITLDTAHHRVFVARNDRVMVIDEESGKLLNEITGLHRTHGIAFDYHASHGFVTGS